MARQCLAHLVQLEGFDDRDDEFHGQAFVSGGSDFRGGILGRISQPGGSVSRRSPANQIWHLSGQMAQKSCRYNGKTFGSGERRSLYREHDRPTQCGFPPPARPVGSSDPRKRFSKMSNRSWFYASDGQQQGPFPEAQLRDLITQGHGQAGYAGLDRGHGRLAAGRRDSRAGPRCVGSRRSMPQPGGPPSMEAGGYGGGQLSIDLDASALPWLEPLVR